MSKIFEFNGRQLIDQVTGSSLVNNGVLFKKTEKGLAAFISSGNSLSISGLNFNAIDIVNFCKGVGTLRIAIGSTHIDIVLNDNTWQNLKNTVSLNSQSSITITCISGYVYVLNTFIFDSSLTTEQDTDLQYKFNYSYNLAETKYYPAIEYVNKPTDLSVKRKDTVIQDILGGDGSFDTNTVSTFLNYNVSSKIWNSSTQDMTVISSSTVFGLFILNTELVKGRDIKITFRAKSTNNTNPFVFGNDISDIEEQINPNLSSSYQEYSITGKVNRTNGTVYLYVIGVAGDDITFDDIVFTVYNGLVAAYPFKDGSTLDVSGNNNHGTNNGALSTLNGLSIDGINDYIKTTLLNISSKDITINIRARINTDGRLLFIEPTPGLSIAISSGLISTYYWITNLRITNASNKNVIGDKVHSITVKFSGGNYVKIFVDGEEVTYSTQTIPDDSPITTRDLYIANAKNTDYLNAEIHDVQIWNKVQTLQETIDYHNQFAGLPYFSTSFKYEKADGSISTPDSFINGTGDYCIKTINNDNADTLISLKTNYLECVNSGTISIKYNQTTNVDCSILYYNGSAWDKKEGVLTDLIAANVWLNLVDNELTFTFNIGDKITNIDIKQGIKT